jgi:Tfp pilus assembly protein PilZ
VKGRDEQTPSEDLSVLSLPGLVSRLRDVHTARTPIGWPTESAMTKSTVERRIVELVARAPSANDHDDPSHRILCDIAVKVRSANRPSAKAAAVELRVGGLFVETGAPFTVGEPVEIEIETDNDYRLRLRGNVDFITHAQPGRAAGIGIGLHAAVGDSAERKIERLVQELLRNRIER